MDQSRYMARHVVNLPKPGIRDFNYGEFAAIKKPASVLIPSNSTGLENRDLVFCPGFKPLEFERFRNMFI
jgi:hypothetical protein